MNQIAIILGSTWIKLNSSFRSDVEPMKRRINQTSPFDADRVRRWTFCELNPHILVRPMKSSTFGTYVRRARAFDVLYCLPLTRKYITADDVFIVLRGQSSSFFYLQRPQTPFKAIFCQKRKDEKISNFWPEQCTNPFRKMQIFQLS